MFQVKDDLGSKSEVEWESEHCRNEMSFPHLTHLIDEETEVWPG